MFILFLFNVLSHVKIQNLHSEKVVIFCLQLFRTAAEQFCLCFGELIHRCFAYAITFFGIGECFRCSIAGFFGRYKFGLRGCGALVGLLYLLLQCQFDVFQFQTSV